MKRLLAVLLTTLGFAGTIGAQDSPNVSAASEEGKQAIARFRVPDTLRVELFAAEPMLANPVAFCVDEKNRFYVAETFRHFAGVTDNRRHMYWLDDDLAARTVEDRVEMFRKHLGDKFASYGEQEDRVRMIVDSDGDGTADHATIFADGFNDYAAGIGAGLLARDGYVWFTCIPELWRLRDTDGDGQAEVKEALHHGYGVHVAFLGHDLHGLRMGPDGRLYFSIGDRGANIKTSDGEHLYYPDTGVVFRCNPDGSELEAFATGLRNPQELAFDKFGNLITCDNNSDSGDRARVVHVVEGGDSGWRMSFQYITEPVSRGPWNDEKLWHPYWKGQAAYIVPPLLNLSDGPSGFTYHPGTASLPNKYRDHFFLADFRGDSGQSGVRSFALKPKGASFEVVDQEQFIWSILATDVDFGTDGSMYVLDWVQGWDKTAKGRLYRVFDPTKEKDATLAEVRRLLAEGFNQRPINELAQLLAHADMRIRQEAQFALVEKGAEGKQALADAASKGTEVLARLHGIWGLGQLARQDAGVLQPLVDLLSDENPHVRAQVAKVLGDTAYTRALRKGTATPAEADPACEPLIKLLADSDAQVRFHAAMTLGKRRCIPAGDAILELAGRTGEDDPYLRHACVMALTWLRDEAVLERAAKSPSRDIRMAALLAYRRWESPLIARFLSDQDAGLVLEAARAINDVPIEEAMPQLAALIDRQEMSNPLARRVLNANFRLGKAENAQALAKFAGNNNAPEPLRIEALDELSQWAKPSGRERITFLWRPLPERDAALARDAIAGRISQILDSAPRAVQVAAIKTAGQLQVHSLLPELNAIALNDKQAPKLRIAALEALDRLEAPTLAEAARSALQSFDGGLRSAGLDVIAKLDPEQAAPLIAEVLKTDRIREQQNALATLGRMTGEQADAILVQQMQALLQGTVPAALHLDLLTAARQHDSATVRSLVEEYQSRLPAGDPAAPFKAALEGGDAESGRRIFFEKAEVSCVRCHKVDGRGGDVGPDLSKIAADKTRTYFLESIVVPDKEIAKGFDTVVLAMADGTVVSGVLREETPTHLRIITAENVYVNVPKDEIEARQKGKSAMPADLVQHLSPFELRDLIQYLAERKGS